MPVISTFYGIVIRMFFNDHAPPHFHAVYGHYEITVGISSVKILEGAAPARTKALVLEWAALHKAELMEDWVRCRNAQLPQPIPPLE